MNIRNIIAAMSAVLLTSTAAHAVSNLTLTAPAPENQQYQQTENSPCIYGDPSCKNGTFTFTNINDGGQATTFTNVQSPTYTGQQIFDAIGSTSFVVGIDVNQAQQTSPNLNYFAEYINGVLVAEWTPSILQPTGSPLVLTNNGNGYADDILSGFVAPQLGDSVYFVLSYGSCPAPCANDGTEEFFLVNAGSPPPVIPEPASLVLLGSGLAGMGFFRSRRAKRG